MRRPLHARAVDGAAQPRLHVMAADARRYVRASRAALRRDRLRQLPSGAQRLGRALHGGALRGGARPARARGACSASGCRCTSSISRPCAASCSPSWRSIREAGPCSRATAWRRRCSGLVARATRGASTSRRARAAGAAQRCAQRRRLRARRRAGGAGSFVAGPAGAARASPATPPPTPTIIRWSRTARRASPTRPIRCRATG